jgi:hypothetical protein
MEPEELMARIDAVTLEDLTGLAHELWAPERLSAAGIGPDEAAFRSALGRLAGEAPAKPAAVTSVGEAGA